MEAQHATGVPHLHGVGVTRGELLRRVRWGGAVHEEAALLAGAEWCC